VWGLVPRFSRAVSCQGLEQGNVTFLTEHAYCVCHVTTPNMRVGRSGKRQCRAWGNAMSKYYVLVLVPQQGGWRAHFPDIPNCRAEAERVESAIQRAAAAAAAGSMQEFRRKGIPVNEPRSFEEIRSDNSWAAERSIRWPEVIVSLVALPTNRRASRHKAKPPDGRKSVPEWATERGTNGCDVRRPERRKASRDSPLRTAPRPCSML
jgi:predicted RNase H-like HicB family nuclease